MKSTTATSHFDQDLNRPIVHKHVSRSQHKDPAEIVFEEHKVDNLPQTMPNQSCRMMTETLPFIAPRIGKITRCNMIDLLQNTIFKTLRVAGFKDPGSEKIDPDWPDHQRQFDLAHSLFTSLPVKPTKQRKGYDISDFRHALEQLRHAQISCLNLKCSSYVSEGILILAAHATHFLRLQKHNQVSILVTRRTMQWIRDEIKKKHRR